MFCDNCGLKLPDHVKFCPKCGSMVSKDEMVKEEGGLETNEPTIQESEDFVYGDKKSSGRKKVVIGVLCTLCCIALLKFIIMNESKIDEVFMPGTSNKESEGTKSPVRKGQSQEDSYAARNLLDTAGVLSSSDEKELSEYMEKLTDNQQCEFAVALVQYGEMGGKEIADYSEDYYRQKGFGRGVDSSGVLLVFALKDDGTGEVFIYREGSGASSVRDSYLNEYFWPDMLVYLENGEYKTAVKFFIDQCSGLLAMDGHYSTGLESGYPIEGD